MLTLDNDAAAELIRNIVEELEKVKAEAKSNKSLSQSTPEASEQARDEFCTVIMPFIILKMSIIISNKYKH